MAIDFPNSPTNGATYSAGGKNWQYNGTAWVLQGVVPSIADASITESKLGSNAVTTTKIANNAVTVAKIEANPTFVGTVTLPSTTSIGTVSATEIGYVDGVTSSIQTQLNSKLTVTTSTTSNRNALINGAMNVWQRGTSTALPLGGGGYVGPDRWWYYNNGFTSTISQQLCGSTLPQFKYCARIQRTSGQTGTAAMILFSPQETINSLRFAGKNATVSFYARVSSGASRVNTMDMSIVTGTGTDQSNFGGASYTGSSQIAYINPTMTTSWQRFSVTGAVASTATEIGLQIGFIPTGTAGASDYFEITGIQLEEGDTATPFEFEDYSTTLAKCQRYYQKGYNENVYAGSSGNVVGCFFTFSYAAIANGITYYSILFPTRMRTAPTVTTYSYEGVANRAHASGVGDQPNNSAVPVQIGTAGCGINNNSGTTLSAGLVLLFTYVASAEL